MVELLHSGPATSGGPGGLAPTPTFLLTKQKKEKQMKKRKSFKAETIKRLSSRSKCYCFSQSRASRMYKIFLSANHGPDTYNNTSLIKLDQIISNVDNLCPT